MKFSTHSHSHSPSYSYSTQTSVSVSTLFVLALLLAFINPPNSVAQILRTFSGHNDEMEMESMVFSTDGSMVFSRSLEDTLKLRALTPNIRYRPVKIGTEDAVYHIVRDRTTRLIFY